jgi:Protein of unknown function (DUF1571)
MRCTLLGRRAAQLLAVVLIAACSTSVAIAQVNGPGPSGQPNGDVGPIASLPNPPAQPQMAEHPLVGALKMAYSGRDTINANIRDYTATMIKRERVDGKLLEPNYMFIKVRHQPFSVYLYFLKPDDIAGREVMYVAGQNNGDLLAHEAKGLKSRIGAISLNPTSALAMDGNRYPITMLGVGKLTNRLIEVAEHDKQFGECTVDYRKNAKVNDRVCTIIEVTHPVPRRNFLFYKARVYVDDQLNIPIRYEAYNWPKTPGGQPELDEEYTYLNLKPNAGLTDADFDAHNPSYHFYR